MLVLHDDKEQVIRVRKGCLAPTNTRVAFLALNVCHALELCTRDSSPCLLYRPYQPALLRVALVNMAERGGVAWATKRRPFEYTGKKITSSVYVPKLSISLHVCFDFLCGRAIRFIFDIPW
jgi:hypothetical protein